MIIVPMLMMAKAMTSEPMAMIMIALHCTILREQKGNTSPDDHDYNDDGGYNLAKHRKC